MTARSRRITGFALAFAAVVALDQVVKAFMRGYLADGQPRTLIPGVMDLKLVFNEGAAFSLGEGFSWIFVATAAAIAAACAAYVVFGRPGTGFAAVLGVVAGGGAGNLIDRVATGSVTDFFMPTFVDFAVFNVADVAITCGFVAAFVLYWREDAARARAGGRAVAPDSTCTPAGTPEGGDRP